MKMNTLARLLVSTAILVMPVHSMAQTSLDAILADPSRPQEHRDQDARRATAQVIEFFSIESGDSVADLLSGSGYYTRILVPLVGDAGQVYAGNNAFYARFFAEPFAALLEEPAFSSVIPIDGRVDELALPADGSLDVVIISMAYHDVVLTDEDRNEMNLIVNRALRSGGVYGVIDHAAAPGSGTSATEALHRIDEQVVIDEVTAAGFELGAEADFLSNPDDDRTLSIFDESIRGQTDRFVLRFTKP
jgi:predicted methyltransferase